MKHVFLLFGAVTIINLTASAQIKKGSVLLGGQLSFTDSKTAFNTPQPDQKYNSGSYNISAGTALKQNSVLGLYTGYSHYRFNNGNNFYNKISEDRYNFGVFFRQYKKLAKDFYFFGELGTGYIGSNRTESTISPNVTTKYAQSGANIYLTPGISYRIYKKLQVELLVPQIAGVSFSVLKTTTQSNSSRENLFSFNTNLNSSLLSNLGLGFRFVL